MESHSCINAYMFTLPKKATHLPPPPLFRYELLVPGKIRDMYIYKYIANESNPSLLVEICHSNFQLLPTPYHQRDHHRVFPWVGYDVPCSHHAWWQGRRGIIELFQPVAQVKFRGQSIYCYTLIGGHVAMKHLKPEEHLGASPPCF